MMKHILEKIGLTKTESAVYLTLLQEGTLKSGQILKKSNINTGKIYDILENLKKKGLVSESIINNVKHFTASRPEEILRYIKRKQKALDKDADELIAKLPQLNKMRNINNNDYYVRTYTGFKGLISALSEAFDDMEDDKNVLVLGNAMLKEPERHKFVKNWVWQITHHDIHVRHIFSGRSPSFNMLKDMEIYDARVLDSLTPVSIGIFGDDKVLLINYTDSLTCIYIHDVNTATSFKGYFEQLWKLAKP